MGFPMPPGRPANNLGRRAAHRRAKRFHCTTRLRGSEIRPQCRPEVSHLFSRPNRGPASLVVVPLPLLGLVCGSTPPERPQVPVSLCAQRMKAALSNAAAGRMLARVAGAGGIDGGKRRLNWISLY